MINFLASSIRQIKKYNRMKKTLFYLLLFLSSSHLLACGGGSWEGMSFYNLFKQTNISAEVYYPFLRTDYTIFYGDDYYEQEKEPVYPKGNIALWKELLPNWKTVDIEKAVYKFNDFDWLGKKSEIEKSIHTYLLFANKCSEAFSYRSRINSWDYDEITDKATVDEAALLEEPAVLDEHDRITVRDCGYKKAFRVIRGRRHYDLKAWYM